MECVQTKKYEKVDSFLKRFLSHSRYAGVRLIEPCVAVSDVYNKQFKFVVLADEWLYVTENPPKVAKDIQEVTRIVDITSVELINDVPEFLGGDLKYRTHHIHVTYKKCSEVNVTPQLSPNSSPVSTTKSLQENDLRNATKKLSTLGERFYGDEDVSPSRGTSDRGKEDKLSKSLQENDLRSRRKSNTIERDSSLSPDVSSTTRKSKNNLSRSLQEKDLKYSRRTLSFDQLEENSSLDQDKSNPSKHSLSPILPARRSLNRLQSRNSHDQVNFREGDSLPVNSGVFEPNQTRQNRLLPTGNMVQDKSRRKSSPGTFYEDASTEQNCDYARRASDGRLSKSDKSNLSLSRTLQEKSRRRRKSGGNTHGNTFDETRNSPLIRFTSVDSDDGNFKPDSIPLHHSFSTLDDFKSKNTPTRLTVSASAVDLRAMQVKFDTTLNSGSEPNLTSTPKGSLMGSFYGLQSWLKERRGSKPGDKNAEAHGDSNNPVLEESSSSIHLYMILDDTVMLAHLHSTWDNCLLNSSVKFSKKGRSPKTVVRNNPNSSQVTALFDQLEKEILNSENFLTTFQLVHELFTACQKDVLVKKLFWQSRDLFVSMVRNITYFIKETPHETMTTNRADELEFVVLLIECLTEMFRETELLGSRMTSLKSKKCSVVRDLILAAITCPKLSKTVSVIETSDISEAAETLLSGRYRKKREKKRKSSHDIELENLSRELVKHQVALLHELFIVAYQAMWFPSDDKTLNMSWMIKLVESSSTVHRFLQVFVQQVMEIVINAEESSLNSVDTTLLYRLLSVLKTILQQSLKLRRHIHDFYTEEFRYYIKPHTISDSLCEDCLLTPSTQKLVDDVIGLVTDVPLKNRRPPR